MDIADKREEEKQPDKRCWTCGNEECRAMRAKQGMIPTPDNTNCWRPKEKEDKRCGTCADYRSLGARCESNLADSMGLYTPERMACIRWRPK